ncbi:MAG: hypothetical protein ACHP65_04105 [Legionellales bacterium]
MIVYFGAFVSGTNFGTEFSPVSPLKAIPNRPASKTGVFGTTPESPCHQLKKQHTHVFPKEEK